MISFDRIWDFLPEIWKNHNYITTEDVTRIIHQIDTEENRVPRKICRTYTFGTDKIYTIEELYKELIEIRHKFGDGNVFAYYDSSEELAGLCYEYPSTETLEEVEQRIQSQILVACTRCVSFSIS